MRFFSDNAAAVCPEAMAVLGQANRLDTAYDGDAWSARLDDAFSDLFERRIRALWVATGPAATSLALAALCPSHGSIGCNPHAPSQNDRGADPKYNTQCPKQP